MSEARRTGRTVGILLLLQFLGIMAGFILITEPLRSADYVTSAAESAVRIKAGVLILLANCALTIGASITSWRVFREYSQPMAIWLIVVSVIMFVLQAMDGAHAMSMLGLSQQYAEGAQGITDALATSVRTARRWVHFMELFAIDFWLALFYTIVLRFALVTRVVVGVSLLTVIVHFFAIPLPGFLGYGINTTFGIPLAVGMVLTAVWLVVKGFRTDQE